MAHVSIEMESASPSVFAVTSECEEMLMPGRSCKASVTFNPAGTTPQSGSLMVYDDVTGSPRYVPLSEPERPPSRALAREAHPSNQSLMAGTTSRPADEI